MALRRAAVAAVVGCLLAASAGAVCSPPCGAGDQYCVAGACVACSAPPCDGYPGSYPLATCLDDADWMCSVPATAVGNETLTVQAPRVLSSKVDGAVDVVAAVSAACQRAGKAAAVHL